MAIVATKSSGTEYDPIPSGNHVARCFSMIHIGTCEENVMGTMKRLNKVRLVFETPLETKVFKEENGEQPYSIGKDYTLSMHEKSNLRKDLESWRGAKFTDEQAEAFDVTVLLGKPCMVNVVHKVSKNGKTYAEIAGITPIPKGLDCPPQVNDTFEFTYTPFEQAKFDKLPDWLKDKCKNSEEYRNLMNPEHVDATPHHGQTNDPDEIDSLPF